MNLSQKEVASEVIRKSSDELLSLVIKRIEPKIPPYLKTEYLNETILVEVKIDEAGNVISARPLSGYPRLYSFALSAAKEWKFTPLKLPGRGVKIIGTLVFTIQNEGISSPTNTALDKEINLLKQNIQKNRDSAELHFAIGNAYSEKYLYLDAIEAYRNATRINPDFSEAYYRLGTIFRTQQSYEEAIEAYRQVVRTNLGYVDAYFGLAWSYECLSRFDEALTTFEKVLHVDNKLEIAQKAYMNMSRIYEDIGRNEEAIATYRKLIQIETQLLINNSQFSTLRDVYAYWIARIYEKMGDNKNAVEAYKLGISFRPMSGDAQDAYLAIGAIYEKTNQGQEAGKTYKEAITLWPRWANPHFALGKLYLKLGDKDSAMKEYNILKKMDPKLAIELLGAIRK
jgi:tetratricopeptide (TPR) repeat protein